MSVSNPNICRTDTLMSGSVAVSVTTLIGPPCDTPAIPGEYLRRRPGHGACPGITPQIQVANLGASTHGRRGTGRSHPADRMSSSNLTESQLAAEAIMMV